jgi:hypothetical protein
VERLAATAAVPSLGCLAALLRAICTASEVGGCPACCLLPVSGCVSELLCVCVCVCAASRHR